jgi:hypothetical protein
MLCGCLGSVYPVSGLICFDAAAPVLEICMHSWLGFVSSLSFVCLWLVYFVGAVSLHIDNFLKNP